MLDVVHTAEPLCEPLSDVEVKIPIVRLKNGWDTIGINQFWREWNERVNLQISHSNEGY